MITDMDIFDKIVMNKGPLGQYRDVAHGYYFFPKLEGEIGPRMMYRGKDVLVWSLNNYLGLAKSSWSSKSGCRSRQTVWTRISHGWQEMMSGSSLQNMKNWNKNLPHSWVKNQDIFSYTDTREWSQSLNSLIDRKDVVVYDSDSHACFWMG